MSNTDESGACAAAAEDRFPAAKPAFRCEAPELRTILQQIANHISEADRRHIAALGAMQERLAEIGRDAQHARSRLPEALSPELDRIDDDLAVLAERLAAAEEGPGDGRVTATGPDVDPAPAAGWAGAGDDDEPWDRDTAEALTRIYESDLAGVGVHPAESPSGPADDGEPAGTARPGAAAGSVHWVDFGRERVLLEERFAEIALRVEKALGDIRRECAFAELGSRFERLEQRVGSAMAAAVHPGEQETLERIEAQVAELAGRFEAVQGQAARLDGIEAELRTLAERTSDARLEELLGKSAARLPALSTETVAELVAERLGAQGPPADETRAEERRRLEELHELVSGFLGERREGDAQTATVLDTMQQAMIRLLDRMDAIEDAAASVAPLPPRSFQEDSAQRSEPSERGAASQPGHWSSAQDQEAPRGRAGRESRYDPAIFQMYPEPGARDRGGKADVEAGRDPGRGGHQPSEAPPTSWQGDRLGFVPPQQDAQNVVAVARRAMRSATQTEVGETAGTSGADFAPPNPVRERYSGTARRSWFPSRLLLVTIAVILAGATFTVATMVRKQMLDESGEHLLLLPQDEPAVGPEGGHPQAGQDGREDGTGGAREPKPEPDSGSTREPELKQRSGEPPRKMHAFAEEGTAVRQGGPDRPQEGIAIDAGQARGSEGSLPGRKAPAPAWGPAELPAGVTLQETGSIAGVVRPASSEPSQHRSNLSYRPSGAAPHAEPQSASLIPDRASPVADRAAKEAGGTTDVQALRILPPAAVGPQSLRVAAASGDPSAAFEVGARLAEGRGLPQDLAQAATWYQRAASRGFAPAQYRLATLLERGLGVSSDLARARVWYQRAAEQGHAKAMHNVAVLSIGGDHEVPDYATAIRWFTKAAERGLADSQYNLGVLHESGLGVQRDPKQAYKWFALAARAGDGEAMRRRDLLKARIPAGELQAIERTIRSWRAEPVDPQVNEPRLAGTLWQRRDSGGRVR